MQIQEQHRQVDGTVEQGYPLLLQSDMRTTVLRLLLGKYQLSSAPVIIQYIQSTLLTIYF